MGRGKVMKEMLISGFLGGIGEWSYLVVSHILDRYMDKRTSNFIGLLVDMTIDFFLQFWLFLRPTKVSLYFDNRIFAKFLVFRIVNLFLRQMMFHWLLNMQSIQDYISRGVQQQEVRKMSMGDRKKWHEKVEYFIRDHVMHVRYLITAIFFFLIEFPARKYLIFVKKE